MATCPFENLWGLLVLTGLGLSLLPISAAFVAVAEPQVPGLGAVRTQRHWDPHPQHSALAWAAAVGSAEGAPEGCCL